MAICGGNSNVAVSTSYDSTCPSPADIDKEIDFKSKTPFNRLPKPSSESKIISYWKRGDVTAPCDLILTFSDYVRLQTSSDAELKLHRDFPPGNGYKGNGNGLNNPINLSYGSIAKKYGAKGGKKMSDGQNNAVFDSMENGLAAAFHYYYITYNNKNICQINNGMQGYYNNDGSKIHDCYGMAALRLRWVTKNCKQLNVKPNQKFNFNDKDTLYAMVASVALVENGLTFQKGLMDAAYNLFKSKINK